MPTHTKKVCIVCSEAMGEEKLFIVDLEWNSGDECGDDDVLSIPMKPTVHFNSNGFFLPTYCVLGSTLYVFDGYHDTYNPKGGRSMFTYELCDGVFDLELTKNMLSEGPSMNEVKHFPKASPTPRGKILVVSTFFNMETRPESCDFELYDPEDGKWQKLPSLPEFLPPYAEDRITIDYCVRSFTFMKRDMLFLHTDVGCFSLDITSPVKWEEYPAFAGDVSIPSYPGTSLVFIGGGDICMIPYFAFDIPKCSGDKEHLDLIYTFPLLSSFPVSTHSYKTGGIVLLDNPGVTNTPHICLLHSAINKETGCHEILLQVYRCNLRECKKTLEERRQKIIAGDEPNWRKREGFVFPGTTKVKSIMIPVDFKPFHGSFLCSFTYIPSESPKARN
ncbi:hypothetical protein ACS0TY_015885 [Phlomoides rotata]